MRNWNIVDFDARKAFLVTYKKGTWDKGGLGKAIFIYSMLVYVIAFAWGAYKLSEWLVDKSFEVGEKIGKLPMWNRKRVEVEESVVETTME